MPPSAQSTPSPARAGKAIARKRNRSLVLPLVTAAALGYMVFARLKAAEIGRAAGGALPAAFSCLFCCRAIRGLMLHRPLAPHPACKAAPLRPAACEPRQGCERFIPFVHGSTAEDAQEADGGARPSAKRRLNDSAGSGAPPLASSWALESERAAWRVPPKYSTHTCVGQKFYDNWHT
jgi:hypothetical protein